MACTLDAGLYLCHPLGNAVYANADNGTEVQPPIGREQNPWSSILVALIGSAGVGAFITALASWRTSKRQQKYEISKHKLDTFSTAMPSYMQLANYHLQLSSNLAYLAKLPHSDPNNIPEKYNIKHAIFYISVIVKLWKVISFKYGGIQLEDHEAEDVIHEFVLKRGGKELDFSFEEVNFMIDLVSDNLSYSEFLTKLDDKYQDFMGFKSYDKFALRVYQVLRAKVDDPEFTGEPYSPDKPNLSQRYKWFCYVLIMEVNYVYQLWYGGPPKAYYRDLVLKQDYKDHLNTYLKLHKENYYHRIRRWNKRRYPL
jgi:hypothetical protein